MTSQARTTLTGRTIVYGDNWNDVIQRVETLEKQGYTIKGRLYSTFFHPYNVKLNRPISQLEIEAEVGS